VALQREDAYTYAQSAKGVASARAELKACQAVGLPAAWEDDAQVPFPYHGGVRLAEQAQFDPMPFLDTLVVELLERGGRLVEHTRVRRVSGHGKSLRVHVNDAAQQEVEIEAAQLVLATGIPILDRGGYFRTREAEPVLLLRFQGPRQHHPADDDFHRLAYAFSALRTRRRRRAADRGRRGPHRGSREEPLQGAGGTVVVGAYALPGSGADPFLVGAGLYPRLTVCRMSVLFCRTTKASSLQRVSTSGG